MNTWRLSTLLAVCMSTGILALSGVPARAQLPDSTQATSTINFGIRKSVIQEIGAGRGDVNAPDSSVFIISRDPFRAVQRGRQLFQRKWTRVQGQGPGVGDGVGNLNTTPGIGSGLSDSCALCHANPPGSAGVGGSNTNRPDTRNAPHLFGVGIKEQLGDEITADLRNIQAAAVAEARATGRTVTKPLISNRVLQFTHDEDDEDNDRGPGKRPTEGALNYGSITAHPDGTVDTSGIEGCTSDPSVPCAIERSLRVNVFGWQGNRSSLREFVGGPVPNEVLGLIMEDTDLAAACTPGTSPSRTPAGARVVTPAGKVLDGTTDLFDCPPTAAPEQPVALVDYLEFYLLHYFKPGSYEQTPFTEQGRWTFKKIGCARCHVLDLQLNHDRRVADVETVFDPVNGIFNRLFATAIPLFNAVSDGTGFPDRKVPKGGPFTVRNIGTDFKRHDLGPNFWERNYDGTIRTKIKTPEMWGVGSTPHYGHDGRSINLTEVILRHGGEAQRERDAFAALSPPVQGAVLDFLNSLIIFSPPNTASNLDPANRSAANFPQVGHGSIRLQTLFNNPADPE